MKTWLIPVVVAVLLLLYVSNEGGGTDTAIDSADGGILGGGALYNSVDSFTAAWARAIGPAENVNPAYNNPGGLNLVGDAGSTPATGGGVIGIFSSMDAGYAKLQSVLAGYVNNFPNLTLLQATARYILGPNSAAYKSGNYPANVVNEASLVGDNLGADVNETLSSLAGNS